MRIPYRLRACRLAFVLAVGLVPACQGDPNDPMTWAKQLKNLRTQKEALDHLANMDVEKARPAVPALIELYPGHQAPRAPGGAGALQGRAHQADPDRGARLQRRRLRPRDDRGRRAGRHEGRPTRSTPLIKAAEKPLPIKSRANNARIAAMRALVKIGDKRAVPTLMKILTTSADEQDFLLNQKAALGLAEFRDPAVDPGADQGPVHDRPWHRHLPGVPPGAGAHRRSPRSIR